VIDEKLRELVSRHLDGDLDEAEAARLEERARTDAELASEIDSGHQLREAVAALAERMEPPATLDKVMDPLRRNVPVSSPRVRPAYRWLGAAAAVVLGVTVAMEMARRNPEPTLNRPSTQRERLAQEREEIFALAPLPTANPNERHFLGATDRLLDEDPVLPAAPEPAPFEVMGPLRPDEAAAVADGMLRSANNNQTPEGEVVEPTITNAGPPTKKEKAHAQPRPSAGTASLAPQEAGLSRTDEDREVTSRMMDSGKAAESMALGGRQGMAVPTVLRIDGVEVWSGSDRACAAGTWWVRTEVNEGRVVSLELILGGAGKEVRDIDGGCLAKALIGAVVVGVIDGVHVAEIVVGGHSQ